MQEAQLLLGLTSHATKSILLIIRVIECKYTIASMDPSLTGDETLHAIFTIVEVRKMTHEGQSSSMS